MIELSKSNEGRPALKLSSQLAIHTLINKCGFKDTKEIAKYLRHFGYAVQARQIDAYLYGKNRMNKNTAEIFYQLFGIEIVNVWIPKGRKSVLAP